MTANFANSPIGWPAVELAVNWLPFRHAVCAIGRQFPNWTPIGGIGVISAKLAINWRNWRDNDISGVTRDAPVAANFRQFIQLAQAGELAGEDGAMTGFMYPMGMRLRLSSGSPVLTVVDVHPDTSEVTVDWPGGNGPLRAKSVLFDIDRNRVTESRHDDEEGDEW